MVTIKIFLDKRRITKDETYPLNFRIYHLGKSSTRSTKIYLKVNQWDDKKKVIKSHPDAALLNRRFQKDFADLQSELLLADNERIIEFNGINSAIAIFKIYARTVRDGNASSDKEVSRLTKTLQRKAIASQIKNFPRIRNAYYKIAKNQLWEHDIDLTIGGANNTTLKLTGGYFAANANKKETQESLHEILTPLRFKQTQYRWSKGQDEYTYYKIESTKDATLLE